MDAISYHLRLRIARATLVLAIIAALLAWVCPFDVAAPGMMGQPVVSHVEHTRNTSALIRVTSFALLELLPAGHTGYTEYMVIYCTVVTLLSLNFLAAPVSLAWIPRAILMKWLWILTDLGVIMGVIHSWSKSEYYYAIGFGVAGISTSIHLHFLPGFYLACLAAFLHFTGLLLIPSSRSLGPVLPAE